MSQLKASSVYYDTALNWQKGWCLVPLPSDHWHLVFNLSPETHYKQGTPRLYWRYIYISVSRFRRLLVILIGKTFKYSMPSTHNKPQATLLPSISVLTTGVGQTASQSHSSKPPVIHSNHWSREVTQCHISRHAPFVLKARSWRQSIPAVTTRAVQHCPCQWRQRDIFV